MPKRQYFLSRKRSLYLAILKSWIHAHKWRIHQTLKRGGHNNDQGRRIPWWRRRQEGAGHSESESFVWPIVLLEFSSFVIQCLRRCRLTWKLSQLWNKIQIQFNGAFELQWRPISNQYKKLNKKPSFYVWFLMEGFYVWLLMERFTNSSRIFSHPDSDNWTLTKVYQTWIDQP